MGCCSDPSQHMFSHDSIRTASDRDVPDHRSVGPCPRRTDQNTDSDHRSCHQQSSTPSTDATTVDGVSRSDICSVRHPSGLRTTLSCSPPRERYVMEDTGRSRRRALGSTPPSRYLAPLKLSIAPLGLLGMFGETTVDRRLSSKTDNWNHETTPSKSLVLLQRQA